jgi:hypothetical protein
VGDSTGSGGIVLYRRERLRQHLTRDILDRYDWFVITRSNRHVFLSRHHAEMALTVPEPIFRDSLDLYERLFGAAQSE